MAPLMHKGRDTTSGVTAFASYIRMISPQPYRQPRGDLGNRRMGEDLVAELIERHALGDRQTADGDDPGPQRG